MVLLCPSILCYIKTLAINSYGLLVSLFVVTLSEEKGSSNIFQILIICENLLLQKDRIFYQCGLFIEGLPLFLDNLVQNGNKPLAYVCGKNSGIRFEKLGDLIDE